MPAHHAVLIKNQEDARYIMQDIGVDPAGYAYMVPKAVYRCIKLKDISSRSANIIKQEMLSKGGEAAVSREAFALEGKTDVLLMGTLTHYRQLIKKLKVQPFGLEKLAGEIQAIIEALEPDQRTMQLANNKKLEFGKRTLIMGILNVTPDSFSDGGLFEDPVKAVDHALQMIEDGADIIDIGGASSRPQSAMASEDEEIKRITPVVERLAKEAVPLSIDTFRGRVAQASLEAGANIINDIGRLQLDARLLPVLVNHQAPVILMHNRMQMRSGEPYQDLIGDIIAELSESIRQAVEAGLGQDKIIVDPGVGFGKEVYQNRLIIKHMEDFRSLGFPVLLGASRKSFIGKTLNLEVDDRLEGSLAVLAMGIMGGADIIRVHDVKQSRRIADMIDAVRNENG